MIINYLPRLYSSSICGSRERDILDMNKLYCFMLSTLTQTSNAEERGKEKIYKLNKYITIRTYTEKTNNNKLNKSTRIF